MITIRRCRQEETMSVDDRRLCQALFLLVLEAIFIVVLRLAGG
jgi:hypothetical protein